MARKPYGASQEANSGSRLSRKDESAEAALSRVGLYLLGAFRALFHEALLPLFEPRLESPTAPRTFFGAQFDRCLELRAAVGSGRVAGGFLACAGVGAGARAINR